MKKLLLATAFAAALAAPAHSLDADLPDPWNSDAMEWTCPMPRPTKGDGDKDPIYKTEIFVTYRDLNAIATFNVRHTAMSGMSYDRSSQYSGIRVANSSNRRGGTQTWSGYYAKNPSQQIVGELKYISVYSKAEGGGGPVSAVYTEKMYKNGSLQTTVVARCHWSGPGC